jgi:hypothetical protein
MSFAMIALRPYRPVVILLLSSAVLIAAKGQTDCELRKSTYDILMYVCKVPDSRVKAVRAEFYVETTLSVFAGHILEPDRYSTWQYNMVESRLLKRLAENELIYYSQIRAPWPASNRDLVSKVKITQDPVTKVMIFDMVSLPDFIPEKKGVVRIPRSEGKWIMTPAGTSRIRVDYTFLVEPGGSLPSWLVNMVIADGPHQSFVNLLQQIRDGVQVAKAPFIVD